ncbi:MAG: multidrug effflux MFS transporter [Phycicoccus sp.]|nr:multidrug effflux MFS transporter [Phycicoccus sp.]
MPDPLLPSPALPATRALSPIGWPLTVVLASLVAVAPLATDMYLPGFPAIAADLEATPSAVQLTLTTFLVGLAFGQLVFGPISDRWGRFWPLLTSAVICAVAGVVCALAPTLTVLTGARLVQGFAGAGGMVIGRAIVADLVQGRAAAKSYTMMFTVGGVAPVLAPIVGALLLGPIQWRGILWVVAGLCAAMAVLVAIVVKETHPPQVRRAHASTLSQDVRRVLTTPGFRGPVVIVIACFGLMMAYIAASPFLYQKVIGLTEVEYGLAFGINATAIIGVGYVAGKLLDRVSSRTMIRWAAAAQFGAAAVLLALALAAVDGIILAVPIFVAVGAVGAIMGNASALAMSRVRAVAGTGSAVVGFGQFFGGALTSPLVGLGGEHTALVPALVVAACAGVVAVVSLLGLRS